MAEENGQPASSEASKSTGSLTVGECLKLARQLQDTTALPAACREYIDKQALLKKAYEGMGSNAVSRGLLCRLCFVFRSESLRWRRRRFMAVRGV
ncbi:unnamed protein product [Phaeothamnion confervicola]